ncbi:hypothetical protein GQ44DRAFT_828897 [Phaeosphaeriaceae sp. PMI808]|nr:hypothetical protein GQ44DRAFT_828897 [Phaeosphaeriaceae sp. PMI808]
MQLIKPLQKDADKIIIVIVPLANKRHQLRVGVKAAKDKISALVDDDIYWRVDNVVIYLLALFEDAEVGAAAVERLSGVHYAADGGCWCLLARTLFIRASILQDQGFANAYTQEVIGRRVVDTTDGVVLTGLIFDRGWKVSIRNIPEAEVTTNIL